MSYRYCCTSSLYVSLTSRKSLIKRVVKKFSLGNSALEDERQLVLRVKPEIPVLVFASLAWRLDFEKPMTNPNFLDSGTAFLKERSKLQASYFEFRPNARAKAGSKCQTANQKQSRTSIISDRP